MPATAEKNEIATFRPLPEDKFDCVYNRPVFAEHEAVEHFIDPDTQEQKTRIVKYDHDTLEAICRNVNKRVLGTGDYVALTAGHTPTKEQKENGMPDPDVLGYAGPFHLEQIDDLDPKWAIVADRFCTFKSDAERVKRLGRCSVEMYEVPDPTKRFFDPVALLGSDMPRLGLGIAYSAVGFEGVPIARYGMPAVPCTAGMNNTFVPGADDGKPPKKARYEEPADEGETTKKVDGEHLHCDCFAYCGDRNLTSTWKLPIHFPGNPEKSASHCRNALARLDQTEGIPESEKAKVHAKIMAAAKHHGIDEGDGKARHEMDDETGDYAMPSETTEISPEKAKEMLSDGETKGHPLTDKQEGFLGAVAGKDRHAMPSHEGMTLLSAGDQHSSEAAAHDVATHHGYKHGADHPDRGTPAHHSPNGAYDHPAEHSVTFGHTPKTGMTWEHKTATGGHTTGTGVASLHSHLQATHNTKSKYPGMKRPYAMPEGGDKTEPEPKGDAEMAISDEDVSRIIDAFMQCEQMQWVESQMQQSQAKGDPNDIAQTAEGGEPMQVGQHAIPKSEPPPKFPGLTKPDLGEETLGGKELKPEDHKETTLPKPKGKEETDKEKYDMDAAIELAKVREEMSQDKARYAQELATLKAGVEGVKAHQEAERAALVTKARYAQVKELCQTHAVPFEETWEEAKNLDDASFDRHLATIRKFSTRLNASFIPVADAEPFESKTPGRVPKEVMDQVKMRDDPKFQEMVRRYANEGKSPRQAMEEYSKLNGQPVGAV